MSDTLRTPQEVREAAPRPENIAWLLDQMRAVMLHVSPNNPNWKEAMRLNEEAAATATELRAALVVETTPRKETALGRGTIRGWMSTENFLALALSPKDQNPYFCASIHTGLPDDAFAEGGWEQVTLSRAASPPDEGTPHETALANEWRGEVLRVVRDLEATYREQHVMAPIAHRALREVAQKIEALPLLNAVQRPAAETTSEDTRRLLDWFDAKDGNWPHPHGVQQFDEYPEDETHTQRTFSVDDSGQFPTLAAAIREAKRLHAYRAARAVPAPETPENR